MSKHKVGLKGPIGGSKPSLLNEAAPIPYLERKIRFSLKDCNTGDFCVRLLDNNEIGKLYKRLGYFEEHTWQQIKQIEREDGFSIEKRDNSNFKKLYSSYPNFDTFLHFRVNGAEKAFRVFGALREDLCYLLLIDKDGSINH